MCNQFIFRSPVYKTEKKQTLSAESRTRTKSQHSGLPLSVANSSESPKDPRLKQPCQLCVGATWSTTKTQKPSYYKSLDILNKMMQNFF